MDEPLEGTAGLGETGQDQGGSGDGGQGQYAGYLKGVPEQFHGQLLEGFKKTDSYWQNKLNEEQSRYSPYQPLVERYEPQYLSAAAAFMKAIQENPAEVVPWLAQEFGVQVGAQPQGQQQQVQQGGQPGWGQDQGQSDWRADLHPEVAQRLDQLDQLRQLAELTGQSVVEMRNAQQLNEEIAQFDQHLAELRAKHGDYDTDWVLAKLGTGEFSDPETAVKAYMEWERQRLAQASQRRMPNLLGASGGYQSNQVDPRNLSPKDTKALVAQMIQAANNDQG